MFGRRARKKAEQEALRKMMEEAEANRRAAQEAEYAAEQEAKVFYESEIIFDDELDDLFYDFQYEMQDTVEEEFQTAPDASYIVALPIHEDKPEEKEEQVVLETAEPEQNDEPAREGIVIDEPLHEEPVKEETVPEEPIEGTVQKDEQEPIQEAVQETEPIQEESVQETMQEPIQEQQVQEQVQEEVVQKPVQEYAEETTAEPEQDGDTEIRYIMDGPTEDEELVKPAKLVKLPNLIDYMLTLKMSKRMKITIATLLIGAYDRFKDIPEEKEIVIGCMKKVMVALMS